MLSLVARIQSATAALFPQFARVPHETRVADDLYQARVDLLNAEHNAEHWIALRDMYKGRVMRLETTQGLSAVEIPSTLIVTRGGISLNVDGVTRSA